MPVYGVGLHQLPTIVTGHMLQLEERAGGHAKARLLTKPLNRPCQARLLRCGGRAAAAASKYASDPDFRVSAPFRDGDCVASSRSELGMPARWILRNGPLARVSKGEAARPSDAPLLNERAGHRP